jgi:hypothetical protein
MAAWRIQLGVHVGRFFSKNTSPGLSAVPTPSGQRLRVAGRSATCARMCGAIST